MFEMQRVLAKKKSGTPSGLRTASTDAPTPEIDLNTVKLKVKLKGQLYYGWRHLGTYVTPARGGLGSTYQRWYQRW